MMTEAQQSATAPKYTVLQYIHTASRASPSLIHLRQALMASKPHSS